MPRTKRTQVLNKDNKVKEEYLKIIGKEKGTDMAKIDEQMQHQLNEVQLLMARAKSKFTLNMLNRTIREIMSGEVHDSTLNSTKSFKKNNLTLNTNKARVKRSASFCCDDEGYTTAETSSGTTSGERTIRPSRSKTKTVMKPTSRSLSRSTVTKPFFTPSNKPPLTKNAGYITPKVKSNTPQVIVRRPKIGEMAWSNQGSPLLTGHTVATENLANVNIPLPDGNVVSLLPQPGVRVSQIPDFDMDTRRQLEILRDNLIKVCGQL